MICTKIPIFTGVISLQTVHQINPLPRLVHSEFFRNVVTLISGTTLGQIISLAVYLILSRIYTPDDFGVFALYMSILSITNITATAKYELAVMMPKEDHKGLNLTGLSSVISIFVSLFLFLLVFMFNQPFTRMLGNEQISPWLYLVPLSTLLNGLYQSLNYWSNRKKRFRTMTAASLSQSLANSLVKVGAGFLVAGPFGLIIGSLAGQIIRFLTFLGNFLKHDRDKIPAINPEAMKSLAMEYYRFPKYNMMHGVTNNLSGNLPVFILTAWFSSAAAGLYSFGFTMIFRPMSLVTTAFSQVFSQRVIEKEIEGFEILPDVKRLLAKMFQFSFIPFGIVAIFAPQIFKFVFGPEWETAGNYTRILIPWLYLVFLSAPFSFLPDLFKVQGKAFVIDLIKLAVRIVAMAAGMYAGDVVKALVYFSAGSMIVTGYQLKWFYSLARKADLRKTQKSEKKT
jgi:O-antigen/teichoic acid export membrane protein